MTDKKHVHKLKLVRYKSGNKTFFCTLPDCTYKINPALALGKRAICWRCGEEFILSEYSLRLVKPHCSGCHKVKVDKNEIHDNGVVINVPFKDVIITEPLSLAERLQQEIKQKEEDI